MSISLPLSMFSDLLHVHSNCRTPEKMALTLLDYLFDRDTQAASNLSGQGKHGKKQLDPLMIYGIRCKSVCDLLYIIKKKRLLAFSFCRAFFFFSRKEYIG